MEKQKDTLDMRSYKNSGEIFESYYLQILSSSIVHKQRVLNCKLPLQILEALGITPALQIMTPALQIILTHLLNPPDNQCQLFGLTSRQLKHKHH